MKDQDGGRRVRVGMSRSRIPRSGEDVGFAKPTPPYACRSRNGRWRHEHSLDGHPGDAYRVCVFCDRRIKGEQS